MKMQKYVMAVVAIMGLSLGLCAGEQADKAKLECLYRWTMLKDTVEKRTLTDVVVLRTNGERSLSFGQALYAQEAYLDSLRRLGQMGQSIPEAKEQYNKARELYGKPEVYFSVVKRFAEKELDYYDAIFNNNYFYKEELPELDWEITTEEKKIFDYTCQKAVCNFRGRRYEAWFAPELPLSDGPWKFHGLPGLILEVYDMQRHYVFEFLGLKNSEASLQPRQPKKLANTTASDFRKIWKNYMKDPFAYLEATTGIKILSMPPQQKARLIKSNGVYELMERD